MQLHVSNSWIMSHSKAHLEQMMTTEDERDFTTFALRSVKHSTIHRTRIGKTKDRKS